MVGWAIVIICTAIFLCGTALYSVSQQERFTKEFTKGLEGLLKEADIVGQDLEAAMNNAVMISEQVVGSLEKKICSIEYTYQENDHSNMVGRLETDEDKLPFTKEELRKAHPSLIVPRLYRCGYNIGEIAKILGRSRGEIDLILNLYNKRQASG